jgi:SH3-like domain-containing protein
VTRRETSAFVTIEGWVDASRLAAKIDTFPASVDSKAPLRVRAAASDKSAILAELRPRTGVHTLGKSGTWVRVRRGAWIPVSALPKTAATVSASKAPAAASPAAQADSPPPAAGNMSVSKATKLLASPTGKSVAELAPGAVVQTLAHDHGFAKVRVEGWVPERELSPADSSLGSQLTAADLRADPEGTRGKTVQWEVEILSLQTADPLRRELARDEPYLLAKGPGTESSLLYLAVPPSLLTQAKALTPLTHVLITARVRVGHSEPVGTPILDLKSISKR